MIRRLIFAAAIAGLLGACAQSRSYPVAADEVTSKLLSTRPPMFVFGNSDASIMVSRGDAGAVRWTVLQNGNQVIRLVATVTPDGENASSVAVSAEPLNNEAKTPTGKNMADNPAMVKLYKTAMVEQIDARLSNREFDVSKIQAQLAAAVATAPKMQQSAMQAARSPAERERDMKQRAADEAYEREQHAAMSGYSSAKGSDE